MKLRHDPLADKQATLNDVKRYRGVIESLPVRCDDGTLIDADERSEARMTDTISQWASLNIDTVKWTMGDNTVRDLTRDQLIGYHLEMLSKRASRALLIHQEYQVNKTTAGVTLRALENWKLSNQK